MNFEQSIGHIFKNYKSNQRKISTAVSQNESTISFIFKQFLQPALAILRIKNVPFDLNHTLSLTQSN
jgi:hypothetical protein